MIKELAYHPQWLRLLHGEKNLLGNYSFPKANSFYLTSHQTKTSFFAMSELQILLEKLYHEPQVMWCRFPARLFWLKENIPPSHLSQNWQEKLNPEFLKNCSDYQQFLSQMDLAKVSLVFSSYHLESPASAFGHTLLRFHRQKKSTNHSNDSRLLDYGINYAAQVTSNNAFVYAFSGIFGLFQGSIAAVPYYYKIREYNDFESRDLWSYELDLKAEEIFRLLNHLWEVGNASFRYYYFQKNCSYMLLKILEVASWESDLTSKLPGAFTIPGHTLKVVFEESNLVKKISYDPSLRKKFDQAFSHLSNGEQRDLKHAMKSQNHEVIFRYSKKRQAYLLETLVLYIDFKFAREALLNEGEISRWRNKILLERSQLEATSDLSQTWQTQDFQLKDFQKKDFQSDEKKLKTALPKIEQVIFSEAPHLGHDPRRLSLGAAKRNGQDLFQFEFRMAYHDILDPPKGMPSLATIEFLDLKGHRDQYGNFRFSQVDFVEVLALNPWTAYHNPLSLRAQFGLQESIGLIQTKNLKNSHNLPELPLYASLGPGINFYHGPKFTHFVFSNISSWYDLQQGISYNELSLDLSSRVLFDEHLVTLISFSQIYPSHNAPSFLRVSTEWRLYLKNDLNFKAQISKDTFQENYSLQWLKFF